MSVIPLQGQADIVDTPESAELAEKYTATVLPGAALTSWVYNRVQRWENVRDRGYGRLWSEYWRIWRGKWAAEDQTRVSERSRLIAPALAQAIEASVSEVEEAVFSKEIWFDIPDDTPEEQQGAAASERDQLIADLDKVNAKDAISEAVLNAAIFGTGIVQINTYVAPDKRPERDKDTKELTPATAERVFVTVESIRPDEFIPDPAAKVVDEMLGAAVRRVKTQHSILEKIEQGIYRKDALPFILPQHRQVNYDVDRAIDPQSIITIADSDEVDIIEYHGKVPLAYMAALNGRESKSAVDELLAEAPLANGEGDIGTELIEAIVTIANNRVLLRAIPNPFVMHDRSIIAFQYEKVPGRFWGRGVSEKGYNPQKGLDATIRSYVDALGYVAAPMLGIDSGRMPRGFKQEVRPGRIWLTQGPPDEVLRPVQIGQLDANLFNTASEMERMVQMGTGAFDTATALKNQSQSGANSATANSMLMGAFVKRAKRAIHNVDRNLLTPVVTKALWRYMQFDPVRYPQDFQFRVKTSLGIVAREVEAAQLTQLIGMMPDEYHQVKLVLAQGVVENTAISNKTNIMKMIAEVLKPNPQAQAQAQKMQELQMQALEAEVHNTLSKSQLTLAQIKETLARAAMEAHKAGVSTVELQQQQAKIQQEWENIENQKEQNRISRADLAIKDKSANAQLITAHANVIKAKKPTPSPSK